MNRSDFIRRVRQLEVLGATDDHRFQWRVAAWIALGYGYVGGVAALMLLLPVLLLAALVWSHHLLTALMLYGALFATIGYGWALVKVFKTTRTETDAQRRQLTRGEAPALFALLDTIRARLHAPAVAAVYIDRAHNAGIRQLPRLGFLLGGRNELTLGLPLMQTMSKDQFAAVLAHEFAHLAGSHGKFAARAYAMRQVWENLERHLEAQHSWANAWLRWFLRWYVARFNAETFVLGRASEYAADRQSASVVGNTVAAHALMTSKLTDRWMHVEFWHKIYLDAERHARPVCNPYTRLAKLYAGGDTHTLHATPQAAPSVQSWGRSAPDTRKAPDITCDPVQDTEDAKRRLRSWRRYLAAPETRALATIWLHEYLAVPTDYNDTHPSLRDRIQALGMDPAMPDLPPADQISAAEFLLGPLEPMLAAEMDEQWRHDAADYWADRHAYLNEGRLAQYHNLLRRQATQVFSAQNWFELAGEQIALGHAEETYLNSLQQALLLDPQHAQTHFQLGRLALEQGRLDQAVAHFGAGLQSDADFAVHYHDALAQISLQQTDLAEAEKHLREHDRCLEKQWALRQEMARVDAADRFAPHQLNEYQLKTLREDLSALQAQITQAWIAKKISCHDERSNCWVLVLQPRSTALTRMLGRFNYLHHPHAAACHAFLDQNPITLPGRYACYVAEHPANGVMAQVQKLGAGVF